MGMADRDPTDEELQAMCELVDDALENGAIGFSTGLVYTPQVNAPTEEVRRLASRLAPYGRPFVAHIRNEGRDIWGALDEFFDIGASEGSRCTSRTSRSRGRPSRGTRTGSSR